MSQPTVVDVIREAVSQARLPGVSELSLIGGSQRRNVVIVRRRVIAALVHLRPAMTLAKIARSLCKDNSSVSAALRRENELAISDPAEAQALQRLIGAFEPRSVAHGPSTVDALVSAEQLLRQALDLVLQAQRSADAVATIECGGAA